MILDEFKLDVIQLQQFKQYSEFLVSENEKYNLTSITDFDEIYIKHFYDSLKVSNALDFSKVNAILDVGSGAGFPGIPLKILYPHLQLTILEPTNKKIKFLDQLISILKIENVRLINQRAEDEIVNLREQFDVVTARAVASLPILLELCIPYVKIGGYFLGLKGSSYQEELDKSKNALIKLSSQVEDIFLYDLANELGKRAIIKIKKTNKTNPIYPRKYALIKKNNL